MVGDLVRNDLGRVWATPPRQVISH
jgi:hypothetical protein